MTNTAQTQPVSTVSQPISPPARNQQYRAIGLLMARYIPSAEEINQGVLMTQDGTLIDAVVKGKVLGLVKSKLLDLDKEHIWVVYPKTPKEESEIPLHVQITGIWEPQTLHPELEPTVLQYQVDEFSVQGEVCYQDFLAGNVLVKIRQSPKNKGEPPKFFKLKLRGYLPPKSIKRFWEFKVRRVGTDLVIQSGEYIAAVGTPSKKPFKKKPFKKKKGYRPPGNQKSKKSPSPSSK